MSNKNISEDDYTLFSEFLERTCGIVLGPTKQYLVRSRLAPLMRKYDYSSLSQVINDVINGRNRALRDCAIDAMTTNETLWFRDKYPFELLHTDLLPKFKGNRQAVKIWCAAASSGQEPYSIAMIASEYQRSNPGFAGVQIVGTDLSTEMLQKSKDGVYDSLSLSRGLSEERKRQFFDDTDNSSKKVKSDLKRMVSFKQLNLLDSYATMGKFDIVFCRNVLIYFDKEMKKRVIKAFYDILNHGGYLMLGEAESLHGISSAFKVEHFPGAFVYRKE